MFTVKGAKAGQKAPRKPVIQKDSVASISTVKILYGLSEGEIEGLANGAASIRLDDTPLLDANGNKNFDNVTWDFRAGTNDQEYIKGFPDVSNETPVNVELRSSTPWVKAFTDTQLSAVRVRFAWNGLRKTDADNGDVTGYRIDYAIDLQTDGGAYQNVLTTKIEDKTSGGYERTHRIDLPKAKTGWQIRVRRITPNSDSDLIADKMMIAAVTEVIDVKLRYPNTALLGIQYDAETFSNIAKIAVRLKGKRIRVPSNYDPVARTYTGIWDGTFKIAYSNNPAWVYFDLCTQWRYGIGNYIDASMIDKWSLYTLGQYCDQKVSDGQGGLEPRFVCNVYLQSKADAYQVLANIAGIFRAMSYWNGERIVLDADVPQDPVYTFSRANVIDGNFEYTGTRQRDRHTLVKVAWDNPANDFKTEYEYVRDERAIAKFGVKVLDLSAFGCTSQAQAQRAGLWALKTEQLETRQVAFSAGLDGFIPQVGNIINVSDELFAGRANGGRVSAVSDAQYVITIDRDATVNVGDILIVNGGNGKSERRTVRLVNGRKITVNAPFTAAEAQHIWAVEAPDLKLMRFRVMSINQGDDSKFNITAIQHEPQKYDAIDFGVDVKPTDITIINPDVIDAPTDVKITSRHRVVQGQTVTTLVITWGQVKGAVAYDVEWRKDEGTWIKLRRTGNISVEIDGVYSGNYIAKVRAVSALDVLSAPAWSVSTEIKGKAGLPPSIVGLRATGLLFGMQLNWRFGVGSGDAAYTEIEVASAPDVNVALLGQFSYPTDTHTINGLQGNLPQSYRARLVDKLGFKSAWSAWVTGTTDASADKVLDLISGQISETQLATDLSTKIDKIAVNTKDIIAANNKITAEAQARVDAITGVNTAINAESQARIDAIFNTDAKINTEIADRTAAIKTVNTAISAETQARVDAVGTTNIKLDKEIADRAAEASSLNNKITAEAQARTDAILAANTKLATESAQRVADIRDVNTKLTAEAQARIEGLTGVNNRVDTTDAKVLQVENKLISDIGAQAERIDLINADYKPKYLDKNRYLSSSASQWTYAKSVARDNYATNERITKLRADVADSNAQITQSLQTLVTKESALARSISEINAQTAANAAAITAESKTRTDAISAITTDTTAIKASVADNKAAITADRAAQANQNEAFTSSLNNLSAETAANKALIVSEQQAQATKNAAFAQSIGGLVLKSDSNEAAITTEKTARISDMGAVNKRIDSVSAKTDNNAAAINNANIAQSTKNDAFTASLSSLTADVGSNKAAITAESQARATKDEALTLEVTALKSATADNKAAITSEAATRTTADSALSTRIDAVTAKSNTNESAIASEVTARTGADSALGQRIDTVSAKTDSNTASINAVNTTLTDKLGAQAEQINLIKADYKPKYLDKNRYLSSSASQWTYAKSVARDNYATNERITKLRADVADSNAQITKSLETLVTKDEAFARDLTAIDAKTGQNAAAINSESQARTTADSALSTRIDTAQAATASNSAAIQSEVTARTDADSALSGRIDTVVAKSADNEAAIIAERQARTTAIGAVATDVTALQAQTGQNKAALTSETTARTSADTALSGRIDTLKTDVDGNKAAITSEATARSQADSALTSRIDAMGVEVGNNKSAITSEAKTRADADTAMGLRVDTVVAKTADNTAAIATEVTARTNADTAITQSITTMGAKVADNKAAIDSEVTARANADTALSTRIDTVTAESANNKAAITAEATARTTADGALSTRIDAVTAKSGANESAIASEVAARTSADSALSKRIDTVSAKTDTNAASINTVNTALTDKLSSQAEQINAIRADYQPQYLDKGQYFSSSASQWTYAKTVARDNYATNERITVLQSSVADNSAQVTQQLKTLTDKDSALASSIEILTAQTGQNAAAISSESTARTTADTAITERIDTLQSTVGANTAAINSEAVARADADKALSTRVDTVQSATVSAQAAADQAKLDATNKSAAAEQAAKTYAAAQAKAEADAAKAAASTDATTKANAAKSAAEAAAALDAKNKADDALAAAKVDATQKANAAEQAATAVANAAQAAANKAATDAGNKGEVIFGSAAPVAAKRLAQNLWIDTTGGKNTPKRWDGAAWVVVTDKAAMDAASAANAAQATANDALAKANANTASIATVKTDIQTLTTAQTATAQKTETLQTQLSGNTASIQQQQQSINGLYSQWTIKADVNGLVGGIGLANSGTVVDFIISANKFGFTSPNGGKDYPFISLSTPTIINGVTVPVGTYIKSAYIHDASIDSAKIKDAAITTAKIDNLAVTSAQIDNAAITSAKIKDLSVDTIKIADQAVTIPNVKRNIGEFALSGVLNTTTEIHRTTINHTGGFVSVQFAFESLFSAVRTGGSASKLRLDIRRDGFLLRSISFSENTEYVANASDKHRLSESDKTFAPIVDTPPNGVVIYTVTSTPIASLSSSRDISNPHITESSFIVTSVKK